VCEIVGSLLGSIELVVSWWWRFDGCHRCQQRTVGSFGNPLNLFDRHHWYRSRDRHHVHDRLSFLGRDHRGHGRGGHPCVASSHDGEVMAIEHCAEVVCVRGGYHGCHDRRGHHEVDHVRNRIAMRQRGACEPTGSWLAGRCLNIIRLTSILSRSSRPIRLLCIS
jgi:hypothetical protein